MRRLIYIDVSIATPRLIRLIVFTVVISLAKPRSTACETVKASSVPKGSLRHVMAFEFLDFFICELHVHGTCAFVMKI
jgi:hypothetical protein